jgi:transketolase
VRQAFVDTLHELAAEDERVWLLTGDLGYSVLEGFAARFPQRFVNVGVAEQNLVGIAAGLALDGKVVFVYSIANFPTLRCLEQVRNDVCYHRANVKIAAVGGGLTYGVHGYTHHAVEDLAIMRSLPHLALLAPGDPVEARLATRAAAVWPGPAYLRLGRAGDPLAHRTPPAFEVGRVVRVRDGETALLISTGALLVPALAAAERLARETRREVAVWSCPWLKPLDRPAIEEAARRFHVILTAEEAVPTGGLGGAVAEVLAELAPPRARLRRLSLPAEPLDEAYSQEGARARLGLDAAGLFAAVSAELDRSGT